MNIQILDNFLDKEHLQYIQELLGLIESKKQERLPLYYTSSSILEPLTDEDVQSTRSIKVPSVCGGGHFGHTFFHNFRQVSMHYEPLIIPILETLGASSILRAKVNVEALGGCRYSGWHRDTGRSKGSYTGVMYLTTNPGTGTLLEDGTFIDTMENRFAYFPGNTLHTGVISNPLEKLRGVINLNFTLPEQN